MCMQRHACILYQSTCMSLQSVGELCEGQNIPLFFIEHPVSGGGPSMRKQRLSCLPLSFHENLNSHRGLLKNSEI